MDIRHIALTIGLLAATPAMAQNDREIEALARETGLSEREIRMAFGARTAFAEYRTSHARVMDKIKRALEERRAAEEARVIAGRD
jgi:hypothetical protein